MTIEQYQERGAVALATTQDQAVQRLGEWAHSADAAYRVAERLSESAFVPQQFRGKPVELSAAILSGLEVGLSPMAAMRSFDIIQGQAAPRAITLRAIVQSAGHEMVLVESNATRCKMKGRRKGSDEWQPVTWTLDRARDLGLTSRDGWKKQPTAMLVARATSELARLIASDAILGIGYSAEEIADGATYDQQVIEDTTEAPATGTRRMSRRPVVEQVEQVTPEPSGAEAAPEAPETGQDEPTGPSAPESDTEDGITSSQLKKMGALMREVGLTERDDAIAFVVDVIGRDVDSRNDLTKAEASDVIDALETERAAQPTLDGN